MPTLWDYFQHLSNTENKSDKHTIIEPLKLEEMAKETKTMRHHKTCGSDGGITDSLRLLGIFFIESSIVTVRLISPSGWHS